MLKIIFAPGKCQLVPEFLQSWNWMSLFFAPRCWCFLLPEVHNDHCVPHHCRLEIRCRWVMEDTDWENIPINKRGMFYLRGLKEQLLYLAVHGKKTRWWGETWQSLPCVCWLRAPEQKIGIGCCLGGGKGVGHYWEASPKFNIGKYVWFPSINRSLKVSRAVKAMLKLGLSSHFGCWSDGIMWNSVATKPNLIRNHLSHSVPWYDAVSELQSWRMSTCSYIFLAAVVWAFLGPQSNSKLILWILTYPYLVFLQKGALYVYFNISETPTKCPN